MAHRTINENADTDVRKDMETWLNRAVPEGDKAPWVHTAEGPDDMPGWHLLVLCTGCPFTAGILYTASMFAQRT